MPAIVLVMGKKEGCNKMSKKTHFVTAPFGSVTRQWTVVQNMDIGTGAARKNKKEPCTMVKTFMLQFLE